MITWHFIRQRKRLRRDVQVFSQRLDLRLEWLRASILTQLRSVGSLKQFVIHDPKQRVIHAACFEERVFHHAIMNLAGGPCDPAKSVIYKNQDRSWVSSLSESSRDDRPWGMLWRA